MADPPWDIHMELSWPHSDRGLYWALGVEGLNFNVQGLGFRIPGFSSRVDMVIKEVQIRVPAIVIEVGPKPQTLNPTP